MTLLKKAVNQAAAAKVGIYGEAGSGKTRTAIEIAIGLSKVSKSAPIAFFDTEGGSDFMVDLCERNGVELLVAKQRTFARLMDFMEEAKEAKAIIVVDSISHVWDDIRESYEKKLKRTKGLEIWDWGKIKPEWRRFTNEFLVSPCHAIVCGRSASIYEMVYNESKGKEEAQVVGSKMKTEKETGYEPSLLIEMERVERRDRPGYDHVAHVQKDRADRLDGQSFAEPNYESFKAHFEFLNLGGEHRPTELTGDSQHLFETPDSAIYRKREVEIEQEKILEAFVLADCNGRSNDDIKRKTEVLIAAFGTSSWTAIQNMRLEELQAGRVVVRRKLGLDPVPMSLDEVDQAAQRLLRLEGNGAITASERQHVNTLVEQGDWKAAREAINAIDDKVERALGLAAAEPSTNGEATPAAADVEKPKKRGKKAEPAAAGVAES